MEGETGPQLLSLNSFSHSGTPFLHHFSRGCEHVQGGKVHVSSQLSLSLDPSESGWSPPNLEAPAGSLDLRDSEYHRANWDSKSYNWDSLLFCGHPIERAPSESPTADNNAETSTSKIESGDGTSAVRMGSCGTREEHQTELLETEAFLGKKTYDGAKFSGVEDQSSDDCESLTLKLGGRSYSCLDDTESASQNGKRCRLSSPGHQHPTCQVDGCQADLSNAKDYHRRHKVCEDHSKAPRALVSRLMQRFCQQCSRFHPLQEFDEGKRSCRRRLAGHNKRRRKTQPNPAPAQALLLPEDCTSRTGGLLNLLNVISLLNGKPCERTDGSSNEKDAVVEQLKKLVTSSITANLNPNTSGAANLNDLIMEHVANILRGQNNALKFADAHSSVRSSGGVHQQAFSSAQQLLSALLTPGSEALTALLQTFSRGQSSSDPKTIQESFLQHLLLTHLSNQLSIQAPAHDNPNKQIFSTPLPRIVPDPVDQTKLPMKNSNILQHRAVSMATYPGSAENFPQGVQTAYGTYSKQPYPSLGRESNTNFSPMSSGSLGANTDVRRISALSSSRAEERHESHSASPQNSTLVATSLQKHNSNVFWSKAPSLGNSSCQNPYSNIQDRTGRISFKLFDRSPGDFPQLLRAQIFEWLSHVPSEMESYIKPGCIILTLYLNMPEHKWEDLNRNFSNSLRKLLKVSRSDFWCKGRILVQMLHQIAYIADGKVLNLHSMVPSKTEIVALQPLAVIAGKKTDITLKGRNLYDPSVRVLCAYQGKYSYQDSSWLIDDSQANKTSRSQNLEEVEGQWEDRRFTFIGGDCSVIGRCFIEIETHGYVGSSVPIIVADKEICNELNMLQKEMRIVHSAAEQNGDHFNQNNSCFTCARSAENSDARDFLDDLGWIFQKSFWQMNGVFREDLLPYQSPAGVMKQLLTFAVERDWCAVVNKLLDILFNIGEGLVYERIRDALHIIEDVTLLHKAVKRKHLPMVKLLLHYVPCRLRGAFENSSAVDVSRRCENNVVARLLRNNYFVFTPEMAGPAKFTPLHVAASMQNAEDMVDALTSDPGKIGLNAWMNAQDEAGQTPHACALAQGKFGYIQMVSKKLVSMKSPQVTIDIPVIHVPMPQHSTPSPSSQEDSRLQHTHTGDNPDMTMTAGASVELARWQKSFLEGPHSHKAELQTGNCRQHTNVFSRKFGGVKGPMYRPFMLSMIAIAAVCVCVCLLLKSPPQIEYVPSPFTWESLDYGPL